MSHAILVFVRKRKEVWELWIDHHNVQLRTPKGYQMKEDEIRDKRNANEIEEKLIQILVGNLKERHN
jgi:hypothetical protein